ncbi:MAG: type I DNA topoisomerase [bacterium]
MGKSLIIVESPAKIKTLKNFLGSDFTIEASMGHVRDLPKKELGVDTEKDFKPTYTALTTRKTVLTKLKQALADCEKVYLATDPDREGEAIAWHLQEALKLKGAQRIEFNEITQTAVTHAMENPRAIDMDRVDAQQARRVLDRLVGYKLSPLLWKKLGRNTLSAGRVQTVAVKLIVDRERDIRNFVPQEHWSITAQLTPLDADHPFDADLRSKGKEKIELLSQNATEDVIKELNGAKYFVKSVTKRQTKRQPPAPFITSTLQQEAARKLNFNARHTMRVAQSLYEGADLGKEGSVGLITYMRTDSTRIADEAKAAAHKFITEKYGKEFAGSMAKKARQNARAQDAHEAIRPTDVNRTPDSIAKFLDSDQKKLYELIWNRFVASQMADAIFDLTSVDIEARHEGQKGDAYLFRASGSVPKFLGWRKVYQEGKDTADVSEEELPPLPVLTAEQLLTLLKLFPGQHFTEPPPRFTEATLVKTLEQNGVGRPSTYATILETIRERKYVVMERKAFKPTMLGETVNDYLAEKFPNVVDVKFTAELEDELDKVELAKLKWSKVLQHFYGPFAEKLEEASQEKGFIKIPDQETDKVCPDCSRPMIIKHGKFGEFYACTGYADGCKTTRPIGATGIACAVCDGGEIIERKTKRGRVYWKCHTKGCEFISWDKPTGAVCPICGKPTVITGGKSNPSIKCSSEECGYTAAIEAPPESEA